MSVLSEWYVVPMYITTSLAACVCPSYVRTHSKSAGKDKNRCVASREAKYLLRSEGRQRRCLRTKSAAASNKIMTATCPEAKDSATCILKHIRFPRQGLPAETLQQAL